jgi:hypothetical protein
MLVGRYTRTNPAIEWILDFLQSGSIDKPITLWDAMFLPQIFESALLGFTYINTEGNVMPLTTGRQILNMATGGIRERPLDSWTSYTIRFTLFGIGTAILTILLEGSRRLSSRFRCAAHDDSSTVQSISFYTLQEVGWLSCLRS